MIDAIEPARPHPLAPLARRLGAIIGRDGLALAGLAALVGAFGLSLDAARWVPTGSGQGSDLTGSAALGALLGWLLARSRFRWPVALAYLAALLPFAAAVKIGRPWPALVSVSPDAWVWRLHLRAVTLLARAGSWVQALSTGETIHDTGLFVWLASVLAAAVTAWLAWWLLRRRQALGAVLPAAIVLAVNVHLSGGPWLEVWLFIATALPLLAGSHLAGQHADWDLRGVDYPGDLAFDRLLPAAGLSLAILALAAVAPLAGTPDGWRLMGRVFASAERRVAETAEQLFADVNPPAAGGPAWRARTPELGRIGAPIDQSPNTVMWVRVSDAPPLPAAPPIAGRDSEWVDVPQHYWRSGMFATYTGEGWLALAPGQPASPLAETPPGRYALQQEFELALEPGPALFAASTPMTASAGVKVLSVRRLPGEFAPDDGSRLLAGAVTTYTVTSWATRVSASELRAAPAEYPSDIASLYLQLPDSLPPRVRDLARQVVTGAPTPYDRALLVQDYLRATFPYDLAVPVPVAGRDAVDYFLFEAPGGFCSYFASAMVVMLRAEGVAARVVTGYAMGEWDAERGAYRVPGSASHAWVEVYFPGYGWVEFEPTPARAAFFYREDPASAGAVATAVGSAEPSGPASGRPWLPVALAAAALAAAGLTALWRRLMGPPVPGARTPSGEVLRLYGQLRRALSRAGLAALPSVTADEYLEAAGPRLRTAPAVLAALSGATALFDRAAYSRHAVRPSDARAAQRLWRAARPAWLRMLLRRKPTADGGTWTAARLPSLVIQSRPPQEKLLMVSQDLLEILRCPHCVRERPGLLTLEKDTWLVCQDCARKYPIRDDIPVMLIEEGTKWQNTAVADLPVPPPGE